MKDNRFIELVNLYIDRHITSDEMAALEAELQENPRRRATYQQYCQMHRATTLVYESFRSEEAGAHAPETAGAGGARIAQFESLHRRRRTPWTYYAGGLAAACVALIFARLNWSNTSEQPLANATPLLAQSTPAVAVAQVPAAVVPVEVAVQRPTPASVRTNTLVAEQDYAAMLASMRRDDQRAFASGEIQSSRTGSLFQDGVFDSQTSGSRVFRSKPASSTQAEFAAFQFQR